jgi:hypothetical protein
VAGSRVLELFLSGGEPPPARVREYVEDYALEDRVRTWDVAEPAARARWLAFGGTRVPALWDGVHLHQGTEAVLARLQAVVNLGRDT